MKQENTTSWGSRSEELLQRSDTGDSLPTCLHREIHLFHLLLDDVENLPKQDPLRKVHLLAQAR